MKEMDEITDLNTENTLLTNNTSNNNQQNTQNSFSKESIEKEYTSTLLNKTYSRKQSLNPQIKIPLNTIYETEELETITPRKKKYSISSQDELKSEESENEKISQTTLIFYSLPSFGKMSCLVLLNVNSTLYYESLGASLLYMSFFVTLTRSIEILIKPFIAHLSDEIKTKMGRRKPFMLIGCGFYTLFLVLLFSPPSMKTTSKALSIWYGIFFILFFISESITIPPYLALGPELSSSSKEREKLYYYFYLFQYIGVLFAAAAPILTNKLFSYCDCSYCENFPLKVDIEKCIDNCMVICTLRANEKSYLILACFIGLFFVVSIILLSVNVKEKKGSFNKEKVSFMTSLNQVYNNKSFMSLIIPWICDVTIMTIFSSLIPFYLNIVINPQQYCIQNHISLKNRKCSTEYHLSLAISIFFISCLFTCSIWHFLVEKFGKLICWRSFSLICIIPFTLFLFCDLGSTSLLLFSAIVISFPTGAAYLNDVMVSDTIDYDEFFTGKRNEGIYTVFSSLIPKFVSLFAQAIPLSLLSIIGFIPTEHGYVHMQPLCVIYYIKIVFSVIPIFLSITSFVFKLYYPLGDKENLGLKESIELQKKHFDDLKKKFINFYVIDDPVYDKKHINVLANTNDNVNNTVLTKNLCGHFNSYSSLFMIYNDKLNKLYVKIIFIISLAVVFSAFSVFLLIRTFKFLNEQKLSFIPITLVFVLTLLIIIIALYYLKLRALRKAIKGEFELDKKFVKLFIYAKAFNNDDKYLLESKKED